MNELNGYDIEDLRPGMHATFSKTITEADIVLFAGVSGDNTAVHVNEEFTATTDSSRPASSLPRSPIVCRAPAPSTWANN